MNITTQMMLKRMTNKYPQHQKQQSTATECVPAHTVTMIVLRKSTPERKKTE
ncbi:hypothetical protein PR003_g7563 [Phytophthora rubi]|uniref:Uncharacterized protein n=1 Tax=Phytophthora rubi TaxID=129364 RepID=A0A6A4FDM0_9STRA|nr:hypothetical protein PR003_g7563 [Phytophthora rubi]